MEGTMENWDPHSLSAKSNSADAHNWNEAMNGPNAQGFWEACRKELNTLVLMRGMKSKEKTG